MKGSFKTVMIGVAKETLLIALPVLEGLWCIVVFFMEEDHIGGLQIVIGILGIAITIIVSVNKLNSLWKNVIRVTLIIVLLIINVRWSFGIMRQESEEVANQGTNEMVESGESDTREVKKLEQDLRSLVLQNDRFLKSLPEYTYEQGSDAAKITAVFERKIAIWMEEWNSLSLGEFGDEYMKRREKIDEIYNICCLGEMGSEHIKDWAIDDFRLCIEEIEGLNNDYPNPELLKEEAGKYIELGDLYVDLGKKGEAADCYLVAIDTAWEGIEKSIKYGMSKNAVETLETMSMAYQRVETLPKEFDEWDCKRASIISDVLNELSSSFDDRFSHD